MPLGSVSSIDGGPGRSPIPRIRYYTVCSVPRLGVSIVTTDYRLVKDTTAFSIIVYSIRWRGLARAHGVPSLLDKIARDATTYFMVIFTSHLLLVFFEFLAPVSDLPTCLFSSASDLHKGINTTPSWEVSRRLEQFDRDKFDGVLSHPQWERSVSFSLVASSFLSSTNANLGQPRSAHDHAVDVISQEGCNGSRLGVEF